MTDAILSRAASGERITPEEAVALYADAPLEELGAAADAVVRRAYGDRITYNVNAHLNPTNICVVGCGFCAFAVWTEKDERAYAEKVSKALGKRGVKAKNRHYVIDTSRNGRATAGAQWCNPPGQGLGVKPRWVGAKRLDAYLWIKRPGESDGSCNGGPAAGSWWTEYALGLVARRAR